MDKKAKIQIAVAIVLLIVAVVLVAMYFMGGSGVENEEIPRLR